MRGLSIDFTHFRNTLRKAAKAIQEFGWCFCPRCKAASNKDFSFCPTCACPKKSRLVKLNDFEACPWCGSAKTIGHKHCTNLACEYDEDEEK